jgi:Na+-driven multidrug efflux pump
MMGVINVVIAMLVAEPYIRSVLASGGHTLSEEAIKDSANYLVVIVIAMIPMINQQAILRALRVEGKGLAALIFPTISIGVNITLNYVFMGILQIGFVGAGLASLIAPTVSLVMMIIYAGFQRRANNISMEFKLSYFKPNMKLVGLMALFGFTSVIRRLAYAYGNVVFSVYVTAIGVAEWKTFLTVGLQVSGFLNFFALGMGQAVGLLVAYY